MTCSYPELGVRSFGKGTFHKPPLTGAEVGTKRLFRIEAEDLVFSNVFAWEGAVAVATRRDDGRFGSHRFITCVVDRSRANAHFLQRYFTASPDGIEQIRRASPGGAGRNRTLGVDKLVDLLVPLPPIDLQERIVSRLETLSIKVGAIAQHLDAIETNAAALLMSLHHGLSEGRVVRLGDVIELHEDAVPIRPESLYPQVGVRGFGGGLFAKPALAGTDTTYRAFNRLYTDAIVMSQVKGWEGALAVCPPSLAGMFVSPEYRTFRCLPELASPAYMDSLIGTPWFWSLLQAATRGVGARRERTRPEQFLNVELQLPKLQEQQLVVGILSRQIALKGRHAEIRAANDALVPATLERIFGTESA
jgi:type I restriction enzyme S subunit